MTMEPDRRNNSRLPTHQDFLVPAHVLQQCSKPSHGIVSEISSASRVSCLWGHGWTSSQRGRLGLREFPLDVTRTPVVRTDRPHTQFIRDLTFQKNKSWICFMFPKGITPRLQSPTLSEFVVRAQKPTSESPFSICTAGTMTPVWNLSCHLRCLLGKRFECGLCRTCHNCQSHCEVRLGLVGLPSDSRKGP